MKARKPTVWSIYETPTGEVSISWQCHSCRQEGHLFPKATQEDAGQAGVWHCGSFEHPPAVVSAEYLLRGRCDAPPFSRGFGPQPEPKITQSVFELIQSGRTR